MHYEILVEDQSGKEALEILVPKIISEQDTFKIHSYKGIGRLPKNLTSNIDANKRILLDRLPSLLQGYGHSFQHYEGTVIVIPDLDTKNFNDFLAELKNVLNNCDPKPVTHFCIAIEEGEAWFLGDIDAIKLAYPDAKSQVLNSYDPDSICGTWEVLADAVYPGGSVKLKKEGYQTIGYNKSLWAKRISPYMNIENNNSPSFCHFRDKLR
jgi:hypothetical protein